MAERTESPHGLAQNAGNPAELFGLPTDQTVVLGSTIDF